jgi:hypothetical protein
MRTLLRQVGICGFVLIITGMVEATPAQEAPPAGQPVVATALSLADKPQNSGLTVEMRSKEPPRFNLVFLRRMSTPGWRFRIDKIDYKEDGRIVIKVTRIEPKGIVSQVLTRERIVIPLGALSVGRHVVELHLRRDSGSYRLDSRHTLVAGADPQ